MLISPASKTTQTKDLSATEKGESTTERERPEWGQEIQRRSRGAGLLHKLSRRKTINSKE